VLKPDAILIQDPTLLHSIDVFAGAQHDGYLLINTTKSFQELGIEEFITDRPHERNLIVPASEIALRHVGRPMPNAALLGGFAAATKKVTLDSVLAAIEERFPAKIAAGNVAAARDAYDFVIQELKGIHHAAAN
jgi:pyruvate ferredoxin oxidoreductase gamma subunit